jgi:hypothetical protein
MPAGPLGRDRAAWAGRARESIEQFARTSGLLAMAGVRHPHPPLRQQLATLASRRHPVIRPADRLLWILLRRLWSGWVGSLAIIQPDTIVRWHRAGFRSYRNWLSRRGRSPSPATGGTRPHPEDGPREPLGRGVSSGRLHGTVGGVALRPRPGGYDAERGFRERTGPSRGPADESRHRRARGVGVNVRTVDAPSDMECWSESP